MGKKCKLMGKKCKQAAEKCKQTSEKCKQTNVNQQLKNLPRIQNLPIYPKT